MRYNDIVNVFLFVCLGLFSKSKVLHPRHDPNTRQLYRQVKDASLAVLVAVNIPTVVSSSKKLSSIEQYSFRLLQLIGLSLKELQSKNNHILFLPYEQGSAMHAENYLYKEYLDLRHFLSEGIDFTIVNTSEADSNEYQIYISIQSSLKVPQRHRRRGLVNILLIGGFSQTILFHAISNEEANCESSEDFMNYLDSFDLVLVSEGSDSAIYDILIRQVFLNVTNRNNKRTSNHFTYHLPISVSINYPLDESVIAYSQSLVAKTNLDVAVLVDSSYANNAEVYRQIMNTYNSLRKTILFSKNKNSLDIDCGGDMGKLYVIVRNVTDYGDIMKIALNSGLLSCQIEVIDRLNNDSYLRSLHRSNILWVMNDISPPAGIDDILCQSCFLQHQQHSQVCELIASLSMNDEKKRIISSAMAFGSVPITMIYGPEPPFDWNRDSLVSHYTNGFIVSSYQELLSFSKMTMQLTAKTTISKFSVAAKNSVDNLLSNHSAATAMADAISNAFIDRTYRSFIRRSIGTVRSWNISIAPIVRFTQIRNRYVAVLIEPRMNYAIEYCVRNVMFHLGSQWGLRIYHSEGVTGNEEYVRSVLSDLKNIEFVPLHTRLASGNDYNSLLKSPEFWKNLSLIADRVLMFQTDSIMIRSDIHRFLQYDYIGAPWHKTENTDSFMWLRRMQKYGYLKRGVGNGGFSLRNPRIMLEISSKHMKSSGTLNEDVFFSLHTEKLSHINRSDFPNRSVAYLFAIETPCSDLQSIDVGDMNSIPVAVHTIWAYVEPALSERIFNISLHFNQSNEIGR